MLYSKHKYCMNYHKSIFKDYPKDETALISLLGRKWKRNLADLYKLASALKYFPRTRIRTIKLGTAGDFMLSIFGYPKKVSRVLDTAMRIGMVTMVSTAFGWGKGDNNVSRTFAVNGDVVWLVIKVYETNVSINVPNTTSATILPPTYYMGSQEGKYENEEPSELPDISIDSERRDLKLCYVSDDRLLTALLQRYPQIGHYGSLSEEINRYYGVDSMFRLRVRPTVTRHGMQYVTFGLRPSSPFCSMPKAKNCEESQISREDILYEKFGTYSRYDVKSSIYRVTWALNNGGTWPEEGVDFYEEIFGGSFSNPDARDNFKQMCQLVYFNGGDRKCVMAVKNAVAKGKLAIPAEYGDDMILSLVKDTRSSMTDVIGEPYGSEVFMHEGFIYMDVLYQLLLRGYDVVEVYDCFYVKGDRPELPALCNSLIVNSALRYYDRWMAGR